MKELSSLNKYFARHKYRFFIGIIFVILSNGFRTYNPRIIGKAIDKVVSFIKNIEPNSSALNTVLESELSKTLLIFFLIYIGIALLEGLFTFLMRQTIIVVSRHIEFDIKNDLYTHYQNLDTSFYKKNNTGDLMNRITEDVSRVRMYVGPAVMYSVNLFFTIAFAIWAMANISIELTLWVLIPLPILSFVIYFINDRVEKASTVIQEQLSDLTTQAQENYSGIRVVQSYAREEAMLQHFEKESNSYKAKNLWLAKIDALYFPIMNLLIGISLIVTIYAGGLRVGNGSITAGNIAEFLIYMNMLMWPVSSLGWVASLIQRASASMKRINDFLKVKPNITNHTNTENKMVGKVSFENVNFTYPETGITALKQVSFTIPAGERWAIIGKTGSGKSTIAELLMRMYDVTSGSIKIDDIDVRNWNTASLRSQIGYVPQDVFLFSETVKENIAFGIKNTDLETVVKYARHASIHEEIERFPQKYETMVGERGVTLSGGQKQRISIARALIKQPNLLILDDSLSAVDVATEQAIQQSLSNSIAGKTTLIITHRIFSFINFDKIIVLNDGTIAEFGTHEELLNKGGLYSSLYTLQKQHHTETA
ncbi:MAG TPA: ABC transporter ATP-binding protein [Chitinophagales bacterium]|nr:ABC transporter ATP-binding protein [Chitinophagales bacterium]HRP38926.1 ABC transporter ATP-binding protein [Chitinophagales bacterium]